MYQFQRDSSGALIGVRRLTDGALIPCSHDNKDYMQYLDWVSLGNSAVEAPVEQTIPPLVTRFQAKAALTNAGLIGQVESLMTDPATPEIYVLAWSETLHFERNSPSVLAIAGAIGLTDSQIDDLFLSAASITA